VLTAEEERLHDQMLKLQLAGNDLVVNPLVRRVEAARVARHRNQPGLALHLVYALGVGEIVGDRDLDLDVLAGAHHLLRLLRMDLRRRRDDRGIDTGLRERLVEIRGPVRNTVLLRDRFGGLGAASREADDLDAVDVLQSVEMLSPECSLPDDDYFHLTFLRIAEWLEADPARTRARFRLPNEAT